MDTASLAGRTVAVTAERRSEELGALLRRRGAVVRYAPALRTVPLTADPALREATRRCLQAPVDYVVASTGVGFRGWIETARGWGMGEELLRRLTAGTGFARGSKAVGAMRAAGFDAPWSPDSEASADLLARLVSEPLAGRRVVVQQHGAPMPDFTAALRSAGAEVVDVSTYRWAPPADPAPLRRLVADTAAGAIDAVTFTSAPAVEAFLQAAGTDRSGVVTALREQVVAACVGPTCAEGLQRLGIGCVIPERHRLGPMVRALAAELPARRAGRRARNAD